jgi:hypothetical protein
LALPSSQISMAASRATASVSASNGPAPALRNSSFCWYMRRGWRTFWIEVAKWPCQNRVSFSRRGLSAAAMRRSHHRVSLVPCSLACLRACCLASGLASGPPGWTRTPSSGGVTAVAAGSEAPKSSSRATVAA